MSINTLYFGTVKTDFISLGLTILSEKNLDKIVNSPDPLNCFSSIEDLTFSNFNAAFVHSKTIDFSFFSFAAINDDNFMSIGHLIYLCKKFKSKIQNADIPDSFPTPTYISKNEKCMWAAGCSYTYGVGVDPALRWSSRLSDMLSIPEVNLAVPGSSIPHAANQILQSDIKPNDLVVWGLTNTCRIEIANIHQNDPDTDWILGAVPISNYIKLPKKLQYYTLDYLDSKTNILKARDSIYQVINFCNKINADLILANLLDIAWIPTLFSDHKNYIDLVNTEDIAFKHIDYGSDGSHPGPLQHHQYAQKLHDFIVQHQYI